MSVNVCSNTSCDVRNSGICVLGNDPLDACPQYREEEEQLLDPGNEEFGTSSSDAGNINPNIRLYDNGRILAPSLTALRNRVRTHTVILIGEQKAGKTTLLACLYGMFCKGPVGRFSFVTSKTLRAFAERYHLALAKTRRSVPTTSRTSRADNVGYFHLRLSDGVNSPTDLIISDRSGEDFEDARVNTSLIPELSELPYADRVCFLLDAGRLTDLKARAHYKRTFRQLIRALIDNRSLPERAVIEVLITKLDKLSKPGNDPALNKDVMEYEQSLLEEFRPRWLRFSTHHICALPRANHSIGFAGLEELVARWCEPPPIVDTRPLPLFNTLRQFDLLLGRR